MDYFADIHTLTDARRRLVELAKQHHPQYGGQHEVMVEINRQYAVCKRNIAKAGNGAQTTDTPPRWRKEWEEYAVPTPQNPPNGRKRRSKRNYTHEDRREVIIENTREFLKKPRREQPSTASRPAPGAMHYKTQDSGHVETVLEWTTARFNIHMEGGMLQFAIATPLGIITPETLETIAALVPRLHARKAAGLLENALNMLRLLHMLNPGLLTGLITRLERTIKLLRKR